jgi:hypothetical protein
MLNFIKRKHQKKIKQKSIGLILVVLAWSLAMGWLLASVTNVHGTTPVAEVGTVDVIPTQYQLAQETYLENCSTCHIPIPPSVLPTQTWRDILQDTQHYGVQLKPLVDPPRILMWRYLSTFSRTYLKEEQIPYRIKDSRYFKALHPQVKFTDPVQLSGCITCHPSATEFNFRQLSSEWK